MVYTVHSSSATTALLHCSFMEELSHLLGSVGSRFSSFDSVEKASFIMGSELWKEKFSVNKYRKCDNDVINKDVSVAQKLSFMVMIHVPANFSLNTG